MKKKGGKHTIVKHSRIYLGTKTRGSEELRIDAARVDRNGEEVRMLSRNVLEQLGLRELGAGIRRAAHSNRIRRGKRDQIGVDAYDGGVCVSEREERARRHHCAFDVGLQW